MPLSPPPPLLVLEAGSGTRFQPLPLFNIIGPTLGLTRNLGACHFVVLQIFLLVNWVLMLCIVEEFSIGVVRLVYKFGVECVFE
jgi:hypothetical protein